MRPVPGENCELFARKTWRVNNFTIRSISTPELSMAKKRQARVIPVPNMETQQVGKFSESMYNPIDSRGLLSFHQ
jgi:hypothetical protein